MSEYCKVQTVYKRDPATKHRTLLEGEYSLPAFEYLRDCEWVFTEKVDGTNIRVMWNGGEDGAVVRYGGRTDAAQIPATLVERLLELLPVERFMENEIPPMVLYGEGYGAKIQKGGGNYKADGQDFVLFDVRCGDIWLERLNVEDVAGQLAIDTVPIVGMGTLERMVSKVRNGLASQWGPFQAEGIVARPATELMTRRGERIITKIKYKDFATRDTGERS